MTRQWEKCSHLSTWGTSLYKLDDDWTDVITNLWKARNSWSHPGQILVQGGADNRMPGRFYVAVIQLILFFRSETWVATP